MNRRVLKLELSEIETMAAAAKTADAYFILYTINGKTFAKAGSTRFDSDNDKERLVHLLNQAMLGSIDASITKKRNNIVSWVLMTLVVLSFKQFPKLMTIVSADN